MVNFICDACGQTIKKQKVEKHYQTECRNCSVLSCIDCGKDFPGDSYATHTSCISEAEKYQGKLYKEKIKTNKGERKQQEWLELVRNASSDNTNQDPRVKKLMARITSYNNVPRKEAKFKKFCENSINIRDQALLEKLWQAFSGARNLNFSKDQTSDHPNLSKDASNGSIDTTSSVPESKIVEIVNEEEDKPVESIQGVCKESKHEKKKKHKERIEVKKQTKKTGENAEIFDRKNKKKQKMKRGQKDSNEEESCGKNKKKKRKYEETFEKEQNEDEIEQNCGFEKKRKLKNLENIEPNTLLDTDCLQEVNEHDDQNAKTQVSEKFKWETVIKKLLKSAPDKEMAVKKLRRKVINEFRANGADPRSRTEQELRALFEKKLHKNPKVKVHKEKAKYCK